MASAPEPHEREGGVSAGQIFGQFGFVQMSVFFPITNPCVKELQLAQIIFRRYSGIINAH